jgi:hypothetical protein
MIIPVQACESTGKRKLKKIARRPLIIIYAIYRNDDGDEIMTRLTPQEYDTIE